MSEQLLEPMLVNTESTDNPTPLSAAIIEGYASDSGLYTYSTYPEITYDKLSSLRGEDFKTVFYKVTKKLLGDTIPDEVQRAAAEEAYSPDSFDFGEDRNLRFTTLPSGIHLVGLSDGPTAAFKDMAMQPFARWLGYLQDQRGEKLTILLSTSGDTGPAALSAFGGRPNTEIVSMMPEHGVSSFQRAQMVELGERPGVHVLEVPADFSDINKLHMAAAEEFELGSANSVNIARIIAQVAYHVASYLKAIEIEGKEIGDPVDVSIPSGNFGNGLSAIIARKMGLPLRNIFIATNENNTLDTLFHDGIFRPSKKHRTNSSAQDVNMPSNVWRYFFMMFGNDPEKNASIYRKINDKNIGFVALDDIGVVDESVRERVWSTTISARGRAYIIEKVYDMSDPRQRTIIDPHTANGVAAIEQLGAREPGVPVLAMETAKPFKFDETMQSILGILPPRPKRFKGLGEREKGKRLDKVANLDELSAYLEEHTSAKRKSPADNN